MATHDPQVPEQARPRAAAGVPAPASGIPAGASGVPARAPDAPAAGSDVPDADRVARALAWLDERVDGAVGETGEPIVEHARGSVDILRAIGAGEETQAAAVLAGGGSSPAPLDEIEARFGPEVARLAGGLRKLLGLRSLGRETATTAVDGQQLETLRRMLLAMAIDIRVVLLRLASRLQTLRWYAASRRPCGRDTAAETLEVLAPLANRLGLWQLKWELEDLAFRFLEPARYKEIAKRLEAKRVEREAFVEQAIERLRAEMQAGGIRAEVQGRPKHIYSIVKKMQAKGLDFDEVQDLRAFRVIVDDVRQCYQVLGIVHQIWQPVPREFDDYIARPKPNGYRSLHTVVVGDDGRTFEIQIRTREMHEHAEYGVAAHWRYKESSTGLAGAGGAPTAEGDAAARVAWVRQLLAWQRDVGERLGAGGQVTVGDDHVYVLTPQGQIVELSAGATPVDFAYHVHTSLGHRCRGAKVDGHLVPMNTPLQNGQTVEIVAAKSPAEGPSRDWLNPELGFLATNRARQKVRAWFSARDLERAAHEGREKVERTLAREGRTALKLEELAHRLGFDDPTALFVAVAKDEVGPRALEEAIRGPAAGAAAASPTHAAEVADEVTRQRIERSAAAAERDAKRAGSGVLVVGTDFVLTQLARCCRPVPPDPIAGFVTRGRGISVHRADCRSLAELARRAPERVLEAQWDPAQAPAPRRYPVDFVLRAGDRTGLLRDVSDALARDKLNVIAMRTLTRGDEATMTFTVEVADAAQAQSALAVLRGVPGVVDVSRR